MRRLLLPFSALYRVGARLHGWSRSRRAVSLPFPVISVGSAVAGGSGKTPCVAWLVDRFQSDHYIVILTRGYGRARSGTTTIWTSGSTFPDPAELGDEPALLARRISRGAIVADRNRIRGMSALQAERSVPRNTLVILDDGFQYRRLRRDVDIVVENRSTLEHDSLIPAGPLREPRSGYVRADIALVPPKGEGAAYTTIREYVKSLYDIESSAAWPTSVGDGTEMPRSGVSCLRVDGIANPERFGTSLETLGIEPAAWLRYQDHHTYGKRDIDTILHTMTAAGANGIVTTEKDAVKLDRVERLKGLLYVVRLSVLPADPDGLERHIRDLISTRTDEI